ncbi:MAG: hypothetical protein IJV46_03830, partial [Acidaminococcaceae bacterium]|nr:hypothetical protein [Acidaminococcaceae bacterium]MBQ9697653.1 hypothetical protein [Acidaminococcaceae bacterium]
QYDATIIPSKTAMPPGRFAVVRVYLKDGRILEHRTDIPKGSPGNPLTEEERYQKLLNCCSENLALNLSDAVEVLEDRMDTNSLIQILKTKYHRQF